MLADMQNRVAIVTGAGGRIGVGVCRALAKAGRSVVALDLDPEPAESASLALAADVTDPAACASAVETAIREFGGVDSLVNLAQGFRPQRPVSQVTDEDMRVSFDSGPLASLRMMQLCYPHMRARGGGSIVNFSSGAGTQGLPGFTAYAAAKEAIRGLTKVAALEWGPDNINVNVICPVAAPDPESVPLIVEHLAANPMRRAGDPEADVGSAVVYLTGPGRYVTGRTLHVDGGISSWR